MTKGFKILKSVFIIMKENSDVQLIYLDHLFLPYFLSDISGLWGGVVILWISCNNKKKRHSNCGMLSNGGGTDLLKGHP